MNQYLRIACISTSRADAGIYRPLLRALEIDSRFEPLLLCSHDNPTVDAFNFRVVRTALNQRGDNPLDVAHATGSAVGKFAELLIQIKPDLVFVLGDRTEMLAATLAATICTIPIAHLHGGDTTRGAYDDACRHAITKLSHVHFPALKEHADALRALGESPDRIHLSGALAIDALARFRPDSIEVCSAAIGIDLRRPTLMAVFHPGTISDVPLEAQIECLIRAISASEMQVLWMDPNADVGHGSIQHAIAAFAQQRPVIRMTSAPQDQFWSCLFHCRALVGNSSAGIIEAASLKRPAVNVGHRQEGRVRARNVIDAGFNAEEIVKAIRRAASDEFHASLSNLTNPYGDGRAAERIVSVLSQLPDRMTLLRKPPPGEITA